MSMRDFPIRYIEPVFRPPSEAHSLILPVTHGCSWNACTFCEMYTAPQKKFRARDEAEVLEEMELDSMLDGGVSLTEQKQIDEQRASIPLGQLCEEVETECVFNASLLCDVQCAYNPSALVLPTSFPTSR